MNPAALAALGLSLAMAGLAVAEPRVLIPMATDQPAVWRYTTTAPPTEWNQPGFDDKAWPEGKAGFGVTDQVTPQSVIGTPWKTADIWLRKEIEAPSPLQFQTASLTVRHDEDVEIYVGGKLVLAAPGFNTAPTAYDVTRGLREVLKPGKNLVAVHVRQTTGGQYIDLGLVLDSKEKPALQVDPNDFLLIERLRASRWLPEKAWKWYGEVGPISGCNYLPRTAVNTTEMWQAESFDPKTIDQELGWAEKIGMNGVRVFVQYIVYEADPEGLVKRMDEFLRIADKHGIRTMVILFDDCFLPEPKLGKQPDPVLGVHNSQWTSSPGQTRKRRENWPALEKYIKGVVGHFARDRRVLAWDLYNEAAPASRPLVAAAFAWARAAEPTQPLTSCWQAEDLSDVLTFHDYGAPNPQALGRLVAERPALCTECIARGAGSRFDNVLPAFAEKGIGWYMWGLVRGRTQTYYPWGSPKGAPEPEPWHHDLLQADGTPYRPAEIEAIQRFPKPFKPRK